MPDLLHFPVDTPLRRRLQPPAARRHPGKLHLGFLGYLASAHLAPGSRVLDPCAGSGSALLLTLPPWRCAVLCNELEPQWADQARATWAYMQASPAQPAGTAAIWQGDARQMGCSGLLPFDGLVCSPPYAEALSKATVGPALQRSREDPRHGRYGLVGAAAYDAILTSPPYADTIAWQRHQSVERDQARGTSAAAIGMKQGYGGPSHGPRDPAQIGNLAGKRYWAAMGEVWGSCVPLVRPGGLIIVIVKNIVRANAEVDLVGGTRAQLEALGCTYVTQHARAVAPGPFHRIRAKARPDALIIDREVALVLRQEAAHG